MQGPQAEPVLCQAGDGHACKECPWRSNSNRFLRRARERDTASSVRLSAPLRSTSTKYLHTREQLPEVLLISQGKRQEAGCSTAQTAPAQGSPSRARQWVQGSPRELPEKASSSCIRRAARTGPPHTKRRLPQPLFQPRELPNALLRRLCLTFAPEMHFNLFHKSQKASFF